MLTFVLLKGWGFTTEVMVPLREALERHFPTAHYVIPADSCSSIQHDNEIREWRDQWLPSEALNACQDSVCYIGWSLGGLLASRLAALPDAHTVALITMGTNLRFVADEQWPDAMPQVDFEGFMQAWQRRPQDTLRHFARMAIQGSSNPCALRLAATEWVDMALPIEVGQRQLEWLASTDLSPYWLNNQYPCQHLFARHDGLVPCAAADAVAAQGIDVEVLADTGHLLPITDAVMIAERIVNEVTMQLKSDLGA